MSILSFIYEPIILGLWLIAIDERGRSRVERKGRRWSKL